MKASKERQKSIGDYVAQKVEAWAKAKISADLIIDFLLKDSFPQSEEERVAIAYLVGYAMTMKNIVDKAVAIELCTDPHCKEHGIGPDPSLQTDRKVS